MKFDVIIGHPTFSNVNADWLEREYTKISVGQQDESDAKTYREVTEEEIYVKKQK